MAYDQKAANVWTARVIPLVLIGIVAYSTWVLVALVCGKWDESSSRRRFH